MTTTDHPTDQPAAQPAETTAVPTVAPPSEVPGAVVVDGPAGPSDHSSVQAHNPTFADFNVRADIVESLADAGITHPFPIQAMTLPVALSGHDIIGQAKTGTGKTLGFGIPALQRVVGPDDAGFDKLPPPGTRRPS